MARWVEIPGAEAVAEGFVRTFVVEGFPLAVARAAGVLRAVENRCSHDDGPLGEGKVEGCEVICPRHGARFDLRDGRPTRMPATVAILSVPVREVEGKVLVDAEGL